MPPPRRDEQEATVGRSRVEVRGVPLAASVQGDGGRDVVWGHGLTSSREQEDEVGLFPWDLSPLARLVRYDARGHGRSGGTQDPGTYTFESLAEDLLGLADRLGIARFVAAGASLGAATALHAAVSAPARVEALVLVLPPAAWEWRSGQTSAYEKMADIIEQRGVARFGEMVRGSAPYPFLEESDPEVAEIVHRHVQRWREGLVPHVLRGAAASDLPPRPVLELVDVPALVLTWPGDPGHPDAVAEQLGRSLPRSEVHVAETPEDVRRWAGLVRRFLAGLP